MRTLLTWHKPVVCSEEPKQNAAFSMLLVSERRTDLCTKSLPGDSRGVKKRAHFHGVLPNEWELLAGTKPV